MSNVPITPGTGAVSVAGEIVGGITYQQIEVLGKGGSSVLAINPDGSINASIIGSLPATITGSIATVIIGGSVAASFTPPANQSVSGTIGASIIGIAPVFIVGGSVASAANQSVSGTTGASIVGQLPAGTAVLGSVATLQGTNPWIVTGSVQAAVSGSVVAQVTGLQGASVSGTVGSSIIGQLPAGTAMLGSVAALQGTNPWIVTSSIAGGLFPISGSVAATITNTSLNVSGSVVAFQPNPSSLLAQVVGDSNNGTADISNRPVGVGGRYLAAPGSYSDGNRGTILLDINGRQVVTQVGSVLTIPAISSIIAVPVGSVITVLQAPSIVGTYSVAATYAATQKAVATMGIRNDTLASIASADLEYTMNSIGPSGEMIVANSPLTKWVQGTGSMLGGNPVTGGSVALIAAQGSSIFTYITGIQVVNASANNVWLRFDGGTSSFVGFTIAPANGGSNIVLPNALKTNANAAFTASVSGISSIYISVQGFISKT